MKRTITLIKEETMKNFKRIINAGMSAVIFTLLFTASAYAKTDGQIDFADLSSYYGEPKVEINLGGQMMKFIGKMSKNKEPEVAEILGALEEIKVRVYNINGDIDKAVESIDKVTAMIKKDNWMPIVSVNEKNEKVRIFMKNRARKPVHNMLVTDALPRITEFVEAHHLGSLRPSRVARTVKKGIF